MSELSSDVCVSVWISRWLQLKECRAPECRAPGLLPAYLLSVPVLCADELSLVILNHLFSHLLASRDARALSHA